MRKYLIGAIVGALLMVSFQVFAEDGLTKIEAYLRPDLPVTFNGAKVTLESTPVMFEGNTYLKLRDVSKLMNVNVNWNEQTQTVMLSTYGPTEQPTPRPNPPTQPEPQPPVSQNPEDTKKPDYSKVVELRGYIPGYTGSDPAAISVDGTIYLNLSSAPLKYNIKLAPYDGKTRTISFEGTGISVTINTTNISPEADTIAYNDTSYIREDILQQVSEINNSLQKK